MKIRGEYSADSNIGFQSTRAILGDMTLLLLLGNDDGAGGAVNKREKWRVDHKVRIIHVAE